MQRVTLITPNLLKLLGLTLTLLLASSPVQSREKSVIIGFKQKPGAFEKALIGGAKGNITRSYRLIPAVAASLPEVEIERLRRNSRIAYVEEAAIYRAAAAPLPEEYEASWGARRALAHLAHASGNKGTGVRIAILDTGIDYHHEDLDANYRGGHDFVFNDDDPFDDSFNSHGTRMAGIVAAEENGVGIIGVAPEADVFAVKVLDGAGFGTEDWIIAGIDWAVANGADIINMSIEGPDRQGLRTACEAARKAGVLLVAAGGNSLAGEGPVEYPAAYDSVVAVTATDSADLPGDFAPRGESLELAAPGVEIWSTAAGGGYEFGSGTSEAAAYVTGAAALFVLADTADRNGDGLQNHEDIRLAMRLTASDLGPAGKDATYGHGLVNAAAASFDGAVGTFRRGDSNGDGEVDLSDAIHTMVYLFLGGNAPRCPDASDSDDNGQLDIADTIFTLNWLFLGGAELASPGAKICGLDPTEDVLPTCDYDPANC